MTLAFNAPNLEAGFILTDLRILRELDSVRVIPPSRFPRTWDKFRAVAEANLVYAWFADLMNLDTALLSRWLRKPFVLAIGGYELARMPEIGYGLQRRAFSRGVVRRCVELADVLLFLHETLRDEARELYPEASARMRVIPAGFDTEFWTPDATAERHGITSVISVDTPARFRVKGGPEVLALAKQYPDRKFRIVGIQPAVGRYLAGGLPPNVETVPRVPAERLRALFRESSLVLQLSRREVFPNAVCEAMLCGCPAVVSPLPVMRETVADTGFVAESMDLGTLERTLARALEDAEPLRDRARSRICDAFGLAKRRDALRALIAERTDTTSS